MKRTEINFNELNGFPLTQDRLGEMQTTYLEAIKALAKLAGDNCLVSGYENSTSEKGWVILDGDLLPLEGKTNTFLKITDIIEELTFQDGNKEKVLTYKKAEFTSSGQKEAWRWENIKKNRINNLIEQKKNINRKSDIGHGHSQSDIELNTSNEIPGAGQGDSNTLATTSALEKLNIEQKELIDKKSDKGHKHNLEELDINLVHTVPTQGNESTLVTSSALVDLNNKKANIGHTHSLTELNLNLVHTVPTQGSNSTLVTSSALVDLNNKIKSVNLNSSTSIIETKTGYIETLSMRLRVFGSCVYFGGDLTPKKNFPIGGEGVLIATIRKNLTQYFEGCFRVTLIPLWGHISDKGYLMFKTIPNSTQMGIYIRFYDPLEVFYGNGNDRKPIGDSNSPNTEIPYTFSGSNIIV